MNPQVKEMWVEALRSGRYRQGKGFLCKSGHYCCLGVLCDLHARATGNGWTERSDASGLSTYDASVSFLPESVFEWAGLSGPAPSATDDNGEYRVLSGLNDEGMAFSLIADLIEAQL